MSKKSIFNRLKYQIPEDELVKTLGSVYSPEVLKKALKFAEGEELNNVYSSIDDLPLNDTLKKAVLEWYARKLWDILEQGIYQTNDYYGKSYDPLTVEGNVALSYVFTWLSNPPGGVQHEFGSLSELEERLTNGVINIAKRVCPKPDEEDW